MSEAAQSPDNSDTSPRQRQSPRRGRDDASGSVLAGDPENLESAASIDTNAPDASASDEALTPRVEVLLMAADRPISDARLVSLLGLDARGGEKQIAASIAELNEAYAGSGRTFRIESVAGGRRVLTLPSFNSLIERLRGERQQAKLSQAALETLAIIAYRQPVLRAELEAIRGVACGEILKSLLERRLVRVTGRAEIVGRPMQYGTTREFLQVFGLATLDDLPKIVADPSRR